MSTHPETLIDVHDLAALLAHPDVIVFDCRFSLAEPAAGRRQWQESHIPGARYADLDQNLSAPVIPGTTGRHPLPELTDFSAWLVQMGVKKRSRIVVYDDAAGAIAARLWWMLRWAGHRQVAVLNGGYAAWLEQGQATSDVAPTPVQGDFTPGEPLTRTINADALPADDLILLDARDEARFAGRMEPIDPVAGHIPGAVCAPFTGNLTDRSTLLTAAKLRARFTRLGVTDHTPVACYCGSGVTAAHNVLALVHAGFTEPALYPGSWSEWITNPDRVVETG